MKIEKFNIYIADLGQSFGTEPGKVRPVVVIQTDMLNNVHPSTIVCPLTTKIKNSTILRVFVAVSKEVGLSKNSDILVDQIQAMDNCRFRKHLGKLNTKQIQQLTENIKIVIFE